MNRLAQNNPKFSFLARKSLTTDGRIMVLPEDEVVAHETDDLCRSLEIIHDFLVGADSAEDSMLQEVLAHQLFDDFLARRTEGKSQHLDKRKTVSTIIDQAFEQSEELRELCVSSLGSVDNLKQRFVAAFGDQDLPKKTPLKQRAGDVWNGAERSLSSSKRGVGSVPDSTSSDETSGSLAAIGPHSNSQLWYSIHQGSESSQVSSICMDEDISESSFASDSFSPCPKDRQGIHSSKFLQYPTSNRKPMAGQIRVRRQRKGTKPPKSHFATSNCGSSIRSKMTLPKIIDAIAEGNEYSRRGSEAPRMPSRSCSPSRKEIST